MSPANPSGPFTASSFLSFSWKGENVATTEVEAALAAVNFIQEVNVYGVSVPGESERKEPPADISAAGSGPETVPVATKKAKVGDVPPKGAPDVGLGAWWLFSAVPEAAAKVGEGHGHPKQAPGVVLGQHNGPGGHQEQ